MKKIVNVNIGGVPFTLDEDAFQLLEQYLTTLRAIYHHDDEDMIADIEARIAELLLQNVPEGRIVTLHDIKREIEVIGDPKDFDDNETVTNELIIDTSTTESMAFETETTHQTISQSATPPPYTPAAPQVEHKLYRDPRNKMIAGVCSGIAIYNHMSVNTVRILTVALFFLTMIFPLGAALSVWIVPIIYACFWIAVPEAQTPLQFMQLYGEKGSMADVAKAVNNQYAASPMPPALNGTSTGFWDTVARIIMAVVKGFFAFLAIIIGIPIIIALIITSIFLIVAGLAQLYAYMSHVDFSTTFPYIASIMSAMPGNYGASIMSIISLLGSLLIPSWFLIRSVFKLENRFPLTRRSRIIWLVLWILCILLFITGTSILANEVM